MAASMTDRYRAFVALAAGACSGAALACAAGPSAPPAALPSESPVASEVLVEQNEEGTVAELESEAGFAEAAAVENEPVEGEALTEESDSEDAGVTWTAGAEDQEGAEAADSGAATVPASRLIGVEVEDSDAGVSIRLRTDGPVGGASDFTIEDPPRLVIDLPGIVHEVNPDRIDVSHGGVERIRVGQHPDMARVVVDLAEDASLLGAQVASTSEGLRVTLGDVVAAEDPAAGQEPAEPMAEQPLVEQPVPEPGSDGAETATPVATTVVAQDEMHADPDGGAPWSDEETAAATSLPGGDEKVAPSEGLAEPASLLRVYGVEFDSARGRDRIAVAHDPGADYHIYEPDGETVVLSIPGAEIDPDAAVRVVPDPGGPVSLVTAFQQPDVETPEVRIVVKRAPNVIPSVTEKRQALLLDFEQVGVAAATPPVYAARDAVGGTGSSRPAAVPALAGRGASQAAAAPASIAPETGVEILTEGGLYEDKVYTGRRISLDFKDADIENLLRLIAEVSDLNIIAGEDVTGKVTIRLVDTPWDQALDLILLTRGLGFMRVGNVLRIAPLEVIQAEEEARLQERRAKEKLEDLVVKLQPVNYADVNQVQGMVQRLLTPRGTVNVDKRTNTVIIKDIPSVIDEATALIKAIDTQTPQVMIEAKIVEANLDFSRDLGAELGFGTQPDEDFDDFTVGGVKPITSTGTESEFPYNYANNVVFTNPITSAATGVLNLGAFILDDRANVALRLSAAENNGEGKVISSPRVVTLDNSEAVIEQGVSIPFQTFENGDAQLEFVDAVLSLKVTPHITADRSIIMQIEVSRDAPDDSVSTPTGSPAIAKNQAKTEALVKDSQTLVLGGIYVVNKTDRQSRTPLLHKLPALGWLFRNSLIRDIRKELLIFVTPRVVQSPEIDADAA